MPAIWREERMLIDGALARAASFDNVDVLRATSIAERAS